MGIVSLAMTNHTLKTKVFTPHHFVPIATHTVYGLVFVLGQFSVHAVHTFMFTVQCVYWDNLV